MTSLWGEVKEVLKDSFCVYSCPTAKELREQAPRQEPQTVPHPTPDTEVLDGAQPECAQAAEGFLKIAFSRLDAADKSRSDSITKAYQIMAFNIAVIAAVVLSLKESLSAPGFFTCLARMVVIVLIFVGTKSALHCLVAITPISHRAIRPTFLDIVISICSRRTSLAAEYTKLVGEIETIYLKNDDARAIIAEHTWLAVNCSKTLVGATALFFLILVLT